MACEFLNMAKSRHAAAILGAMHGVEAPDGDWLMTWGAGHPAHAAAIARHRGPWGAWDIGYFGEGFYRVGVNRWHPTALQIDRTRSDEGRWAQHGIGLREDADPAGPILLIGMGPKSKLFLGLHDWEARTLKSLRLRYPDRRIRFRPKPGRPFRAMGCEISMELEIEDALRGASLVVCRHSNVAIDACIAGIPAECEDGAAAWLQGRPFEVATRIDFLQRVACWQWRPSEAVQAWKFIEEMSCN